jgi:hypothetical protein
MTPVNQPVFFCLIFISKLRSMKFFILPGIILIFLSCNDQKAKNEPGGNHPDKYSPIQASRLTVAQIPASIPVSGQADEAWQWTDKQGEHIFITSFNQPRPDSNVVDSEEGQGYTAALFASHFIKKGNVYQLVWRETDSVKACAFDITCQFMKGATSITDLDSNGIAEIKFQYKTACRSDVSPAECKLVIREDTSRYVLHGTLWVKLDDTDSFQLNENNANLETLPGYQHTDEEYLKRFGRYASESSFAKAPAAFLRYARQQWIKYAVEFFQ